MTDKMQNWLSGKPVDLAPAEEVPRFISYDDDNCPYNRASKEPLTLDLLLECIDQMEITRKPLPRSVSEQIREEIGLLQSSCNGQIFVREKGSPRLDPKRHFIQNEVVSYVENARKYKFDLAPLKTIKEQLGIKRSTYYVFRKRCPDYWVGMDEPPTSGKPENMSEKDYMIYLLKNPMKRKLEYLKGYFKKT